MLTYELWGVIITDYGVTDSGFVIKPLDVLIAEAADSSTTLFGTNIDVSDSSPLGKINQTVCSELSIYWEKMNETYFAAFLDSASGENLDKIVYPLGINRKPAVLSVGYAAFTGTVGTTVPGSTTVKTVDDSPIEFKTDASFVLTEMVTNGEFTANTTSWTAENAATLASVSKKLDFTSGGTHEVIVGDTLTGETGGATAVVSAIILSGGTWAAGTAAGTFYFSTQTGAFETETLKEGANLDVCNVAADSTDTSGVDGNALLVICDGTNNPFAEQTITVEEHHFYDLSVFVKAGTAATYNVNVYDESNSADIFLSGDLTETAGDWSVEVSEQIEIPDDCTSVSIRLFHRATSGDATTMLFDTCKLIHVSSAITAVIAGIAGDVAAGTITSLSSPISGITSVTNPNGTEDGAAEETDVALRIRTKQSIGAGGKATLNAIVAEVLEVDNVSSVTIEENETDTDYTDLLTNSGFTSDTSSWTLGNAATLASVAGGESGNCLRITCDGSDDPYAHQTATVVAGDNYIFNVYVKAGTEATYAIKIYDVSNAGYIYESAELEETAVDWSTLSTKSFTAPSGCTSVRIELYQIATAGAATTFFFDTAILDGLPPHSVRVSVSGGTDNNVAQALLDSVAAGIRTYGDETGDGTIDNGQTFARYFARPNEILIYVSATITSDDTYAGDEAVETAIIDYIGGVDADSVTHVGIGAGADVIFYEVVSAIMDVTGVTNVTVSISVTTPPAATSDITISSTEVSYTTTSAVVIS